MKIITLIFFTFIFCASPVLSQDVERSVNDNLFKMRADRKHVEAIAYLNNLIQAAPNDANLYINRAEFLGLQNKLDEAISDVNHAIEIQPDKASFYLERAKYFNLAKNNKAVIENVRAAISLAPENESILSQGTGYLFLIGQYEENIKIAASRLDIDELSYWAYKVSAKNKFALKNYTEVLEDSISAIELLNTAGNKNSSADSAQIEFSNLDQFEMIYSIMTVHLKDDKNIFNYYNRLIELFERKTKEVEKRLLDAAEIKGTLFTGPDALMRSRLGFLLESCAKLYEQKKQSEKAEELLGKLVQLRPSWNYYPIRSAYFERTGNYQEAINDLTTAIEISENNLKTYFEVRVFGRAGFPPYLIWKINVLIKRGDLYILAKQDEQAITDYQQAIADLKKIVPANPETATELNRITNLAKLKLYGTLEFHHQ